jgi:hypothetical protein
MMADEEHAFLRTSKDTLVAGYQRRYVLVNAQFRNAERQHPPAVVSAEAVVSAKPHVSIFVLNNMAYGIGSQSILHADMPILEIIPAPTVGKGTKNKDKDKG